VRHDFDSDARPQYRRPPRNKTSIFWWVGLAVAVGVAGGLVVVAVYVHSRPPEPAPLTHEERVVVESAMRDLEAMDTFAGELTGKADPDGDSRALDGGHLGRVMKSYREADRVLTREPHRQQNEALVGHLAAAVQAHVDLLTVWVRSHPRVGDEPRIGPVVGDELITKYDMTKAVPRADINGIDPERASALILAAAKEHMAAIRTRLDRP
jgi:hypothetical protein